MKQSLQLRLGQHLTMTPQLQQAIRLLQLSTIELKAEIQDALESNPMLEAAEESAEAVEESYSSGPSENFVAEGDEKESATSDIDFQRNEELPQDLPVDSNWEDTFDLGTTYNTNSQSQNGDDDSSRDIDARNYEEESLRDYLVWQMQLTPFTDTDIAIATAIIDSIDDDGYLKTSTSDIHEDLKRELDIELDEVEAVLHAIQNFDPPGIAARDLRECLLIQIRQLDPTCQWHSQALNLLENHFDLLAARDYTQLMRKMKINNDDLTDVIKFVHTLNPRPGGMISTTKPEYIVPDVYVRKYEGVWRVSLNSDATPKLNINSMYAGLIQRANKSADNTYLQGQLQEARWLIKSLQSRNETLMKVATCIVERQQGFLEQGEEAMKALVLHDVAETVGMHESTISRITNKKYMHTPRGIFELKYFFSSHVGTTDGGECSSTAIRALIKKMVTGEDARKPLSDSKIAKVLSEQGINVARRTVAKYRDAMAIPPSNERKRIA